ncbi:MAG: hypothetical protein JRI91_10720 [Deltaproteobacteria bacterium]|nr:hypothetical protein [Deltaproteobacteria bacterium]
MKKPIEINITLKKHAVQYFYLLLSKGFRIQFKPGCSIKNLLCQQLGFDETYVSRRIQTIFLNGKAVDNINTTVVSDKSTLALSAAMPGLAGAIFRTGSRYSAMRNSISYSAHEKQACEDSGLLELKLFNLVARETGEMILLRGILVNGKDLCSVIEEHSEVFEHQDNKIYLNHKKIDMGNLLSSGIKETVYLFLTVL